jgi:hypothetical protein
MPTFAGVAFGAGGGSTEALVLRTGGVLVGSSYVDGLGDSGS